jgi:hypothetical protein
MRTVGAQPDTARRYPPLAADAGLEVVSQRGVFFPAPPPAAIGETSNLLRAATGAITAAGLATRDEIEKLLHEMGVDQGRAAFATTPFAIELIARKPA